MEKKIKIIVADDHEVYRKGIAEIVRSLGNAELIAEACNGKELLNVLSQNSGIPNKNPIDVIFMDVKMPVMNGIEATREVSKKYPSIKVITLTMFGDEKFLQNMIDSGAKGFLLKNTTAKEIKTAISKVIEGGTYFSKKFILSALQRAYENRFKNKSDEPDKIKLTDREYTIIQLIAKGKSFDEIGETLNIKYNTVKNYVYPLFKKTMSKNKTELILYALKNRLIEMEALNIENEELILETFTF